MTRHRSRSASSVWTIGSSRYVGEPLRDFRDGQARQVAAEPIDVGVQRVATIAARGEDLRGLRVQRLGARPGVQPGQPVGLLDELVRIDRLLGAGRRVRGGKEQQGQTGTGAPEPAGALARATDVAAGFGSSDVPLRGLTLVRDHVSPLCRDERAWGGRLIRVYLLGRDFPAKSYKPVVAPLGN